jgi:UDP-N-acetylmuramate--alanine ligase
MEQCSNVKIFCSGIGGIGLSAYAAYQQASGHDVSGSDKNESALIRDLRSQGIVVFLEQEASNIPRDCDLFVYTLALSDDHPEKKRAKEMGIKQMTYFEALGELTKAAFLIAVCGTSGKSSTTAMAAKVLMDGGLDPSVILGTKTPDLDGRNWRKSGSHSVPCIVDSASSPSPPCHHTSNTFLVEACEYCNSFHHLSPAIVVMTNAYGDHFDAYSGIEEYEESFKKFLKSIPSEGALITHLSDPQCKKLSASASCSVIDADSQPLPPLQVPGEHMQHNAQLVLALARYLDLQDPEASLKAYKGCWRRMEVKGTWNVDPTSPRLRGAQRGKWIVTHEEHADLVVIDDYGHHPNEVRVTLKGLKKHYPDRRLVCVFQPHTHDRVRKLYDLFLTAFKAADLVIIPNIFAARSERDSEKVDPKKLVADIAERSLVEALYGESLVKTAAMLQESILKKNDLLVTMGAGDVGKICDIMFPDV